MNLAKHSLTNAIGAAPDPAADSLARHVPIVLTRFNMYLQVHIDQMSVYWYRVTRSRSELVLIIDGAVQLLQPGCCDN